MAIEIQQVSTLPPVSNSFRATLPRPLNSISSLQPAQSFEPVTVSVTADGFASNGSVNTVYNRFARITSELASTGANNSKDRTGSSAAALAGDAPSGNIATNDKIQRAPATEAAVRGGDDAQLSSQSATTAEPENTSSAKSEVGSDQIPSSTEGNSSASASGLSGQQLEQVRELAARDREVRSHEQAHMAAGGQYAGAPQYSFQKGPDGVNYAVGGEVSIDTGTIAGDPEATIRKMEQVRRAALAPANPSPQDRAVSAQATQAILQARTELSQQSEQESASLNGSDNQPVEDANGPAEAAGLSRGEREALQTYQELSGLGRQIDKAGDSLLILNKII